MQKSVCIVWFHPLKHRAKKVHPFQDVAVCCRGFRPKISGLYATAAVAAANSPLRAEAGAHPSTQDGFGSVKKSPIYQLLARIPCERSILPGRCFCRVQSLYLGFRESICLCHGDSTQKLRSKTSEPPIYIQGPSHGNPYVRRWNCGNRSEDIMRLLQWVSLGVGIP